MIILGMAITIICGIFYIYWLIKDLLQLKTENKKTKSPYKEPQTKYYEIGYYVRYNNSSEDTVKETSE